MIRLLTLSDAPQWRQIRLEALAQEPQAYASALSEWQDRPLEDFESHLINGHYIGAFDEDRLAGVIGLFVQSRKSASHRGTIVAAYVKPDLRGTGIAADMMTAMIAHAQSLGLRQVELNVLESNARACTYYRRHGFVQIGATPDAHCDNGVFEDDLTMLRRVDA